MNTNTPTIQVLGAMIATGREEPMMNVMDVLKGQLSYDAAFDLANDMQNRNLVKLVYCSHPNVVNVQLTLVGEQEFEKSRA